MHVDGKEPDSLQTMRFWSKLFAKPKPSAQTEPASTPEGLSYLPPEALPFLDGANLTPGVRTFLEGEKDSFTSADIDPENNLAYGRYEQAMLLKKQGDLAGAAALLEPSCKPPSIYKGHYRELFKIWRQFNREDLAAGRHKEVIERVLAMVKLDDEMIAELLRHWSNVQNRQLPKTYFDESRNLLMSDAKALLKAASALDEKSIVRTATKLIDRNSQKART